MDAPATILLVILAVAILHVAGAIPVPIATSLGFTVARQVGDLAAEAPRVPGTVLAPEPSPLAMLQTAIGFAATPPPSTSCSSCRSAKTFVTG